MKYTEEEMKMFVEKAKEHYNILASAMTYRTIHIDFLLKLDKYRSVDNHRIRWQRTPLYLQELLDEKNYESLEQEIDDFPELLEWAKEDLNKNSSGN